MDFDEILKMINQQIQDKLQKEYDKIFLETDLNILYGTDGFEAEYAKTITYNTVFLQLRNAKSERLRRLAPHFELKTRCSGKQNYLPVYRQNHRRHKGIMSITVKMMGKKVVSLRG